jgi:hypothetical protein
MTNDIYKSPEADLALDSTASGSQFYVVSKQKMAVLLIATFGIYSIYWFYKNWRNYKDHSRESLRPMFRAIFNIFYAHALFRKVDEVIKERGSSFEWSPGLLATLYVLLAVLSSACERLSAKEMGSPWTDVGSLATLPFLLLIFLKVQPAINLSQNDPDGVSNRNFSGANYAWIIFGGLFWILVLIGMLDTFGLVSLDE